MVVNQQPITSITIGGETIYGGEVNINAPGSTIDPDTGEITFPEPLPGPQGEQGPQGEIGPQGPPGPSGVAGIKEPFVITSTDITNKYLLVSSDITIDQYTLFEIATLAPQFYSVDFVVDGTNKKMVKWNGLGLDGLIEEGDQVNITYF